MKVLLVIPFLMLGSCANVGARTVALGDKVLDAGTVVIEDNLELRDTLRKACKQEIERQLKEAKGDEIFKLVRKHWPPLVGKEAVKRIADQVKAGEIILDEAPAMCGSDKAVSTS